MECGFAGGGSLLDVFDTRNLGLGMPLDSMSPKEVYKTLLDAQSKREPIDVVTGKRTYKNMLIRALEVSTDRTTENVLMCTVTLREVIITQTKKINVAAKEDMKFGASTMAVQDMGTKSLVPANESIAVQAFDFLKNLAGR